MKSKTIVITGANTGIGKATAISLAHLGYKLILINRDSNKSREALKDIISQTNNTNITNVYADLGNKSEIIDAADKIMGSEEYIDVLINNAGVFKPKATYTKDGIELNLAINYLATVRLTAKLLPLLKKSEQGRIINLASEVYKKGNLNNNIFINPKKYNGLQRYADTKLAIVLYTQKLAQIENESNITVNCLHPGVIASDVARDYSAWIKNISGLMLTSTTKGAIPSFKLATDPNISNCTGSYFYKERKQKIKKKVTNQEHIDHLWDLTTKYIDL